MPAFTFSSRPKKTCSRFEDAPEILTENTDHFIIGDRVWVNGTKPGYIQYIGETQFAPGEWAGVVLDEPIGKNDGSVAGVRYFQCEPKRGVFARLHRLTQFPLPRNGTSEANGSNPAGAKPLSGKTVTTTTTTTTKVVRTSSPSGSVRSISSPTKTITTTTTVDHGLRIGDRVVVNATSGTKMGTLRYLGTTDFASGEWAGVELDEPVGKNDGSVAGKRYFDCKMKYGLFAPVHKVTRAGRSATPKTSRVSSTPLQHRRTGSHESLTSSLSSTSSAARAGRVRLGVTSLTNMQKSATRPMTTSVSATNAALQEETTTHGYRRETFAWRVARNCYRRSQKLLPFPGQALKV